MSLPLNPQLIESLRAQFPALNRPVNGGGLPVHFDNPAGTQVSQRVIDAVSDYYTTMNANSGGAFATSQRNDAMVEAARQSAADFLNAPDYHEIVFGPNMTTLSFALSRAIGKTLQAGDEIVLTMMDHDANIAPWLRIAEDYDLVVRWVDIRPEDCTLDMDSLEAALTDRTKVVATVHASNAVGTINPVQKIAAMAHAAGAYYVVDAVQSAPHIPIDVQAIGCDFLLCSAYKFFGPHIGILWGKFDLLERLPAYKVRPSKNVTPYRWETGTPSFETIAGTKAALEYLAEIGRLYGGSEAQNFSNFTGRRLDFKTGMTTLAAYERELVAYLIEMLKSLQGIEIAGITDPAHYHERVPTVVFTRRGYSPLEIATHLAQHDIYVWDGNYYALAIMERLGKQESGGMVRVGLAHYNTHAEIDRLESALKRV
ncbi:MAG: cysteine desulfurase-like protein [Chloroflexota bacterium]|nr:cysteine desulfurase-like protein [Chloroflexota bacterium]NOG65302.1 cysteine desulfurase-like protein [Chloroflexota bacterium]GIK66689.1 MAG: cysteine desulfurase-like protein [Chloroflexota bacterium]